jgi:hypothetical protein
MIERIIKNIWIIKIKIVYSQYEKNNNNNMKKIKLSVLEYLKYERDERIPELIEMYDGDVKYVEEEIWGGPLETILDGKTDEDLINIINEIIDNPSFEEEFNEYKEYMKDNNNEVNKEELYMNFVWECITDPN